MLKRFTSCLLAFLMVFNLCLPAYAVDTVSNESTDTPALSITVDKTEANVGDTVTVTISCDKGVTGLQTWGMDLCLDPNAYTLESSSVNITAFEYVGAVTDNLKLEKQDGTYAGYVNIMAATTSNTLLSIPSGDFATLTFKVTAESTGSFELKNVEAYIPNDDKSVIHLVGPEEGIKVIVCTHTWAEGVCSKCETVCAHAEYKSGVCKVCGKAEEVAAASAPMTVTVNGAAMEVKFVENSDGQNWYFVSVNVSDLSITGTTDNPIAKVNNKKVTDGTGSVALSALTATGISDMPSVVAACAKADTTELYACSLQFTNATNLPVEMKYATLFIEMSCEHNWLDAGCTTPETCEYCGAVKTGSVPAGHILVGDGTCENCDTGVPAISATANGKEVDLAFVTDEYGDPVYYLEIHEGSDLEIVKSGSGAYTDNYTWAQIKAAYQTTERQDGSPGWLDWPEAYNLPLKTSVDDLENMPYFKHDTNSSGTAWDFYVIGVISHPDHNYVNGECGTCGKACTHTWAEGVCGTCGTTCDHAKYENGACKVCGKAEEVAAASAPMTVTVNGAAMEVKFVENSDGQNWYFVSVNVSDLSITGTTDNPIAKVNNKKVTDGTGSVALSALTATGISDMPSVVAACAKADTTELYACSLQFTNATNLPVEMKYATLFIEMSCEHNWLDAGCTTPETCEYCGAVKTGSVPAGHILVGDGTCENCDTGVPAISATANGKEVDLAFVTDEYGDPVYYLEIHEGSDLEIVKSGSGAYTDNYTWAQIKAAYQTTERQDGSPGWLDWPEAYNLPLKTSVDDLENMPYFKHDTNSSGTAWDFYVIGVISHPDHNYVNGECGTCGKAEPKTSNPIQAVEAKNPLLNKTSAEDATAPVYSVTLMSGVTEDLQLDITVENPDKEATQQLTWSSTNEAVAKVEDGKLITGTVTESTTVTLTATVASEAAAAAIDGEGSDALITLNVTVNPVDAGYTVTMGADVPVVADETIRIPVTVTHTDADVKNYKSFELVFQYDPDLLTLVTGSSTGEGKDLTVVVENGTVTVRRYGDALSVGTAAITLEFTAKKTGDTNVKLISAKVGTSADAQGENIPTAQIVDNITLITVAGYTVNLPDEFEGASVVAPGKDYTFTAKNLNYGYTITATIGNQTLTVTGSGTEADPYKITADQITGNIEITTEKSGKKFDVTITENMDMAPAEGFTTGKDAAQYGKDYKVVLTKDNKFEYGVTITIGNDTYTCTPDENGVYTIVGSAITGNINITVTKTQVKFDPHDVTITGSGAEDVVEDSAAEKAEHDKDYTFAIKMTEGFAYTVTVDMGGTAVEAVKADEANEDGSYTYTIAKVTANLTIQIEKSNLTVEVNEYVKLNGKTVFLVTATQTLPEGQTLAYGTEAQTMYLKNYQVNGESVQMYSYLVIVESGTLSVEDATAQIKVVEATSTVLEDTFNVNQSTALDINDAQLVYDLYNNVYQDITTVGMQKFLLADVNGSRNINVSDAAAVVNAILEAK